jgi:ABC-type hemin transport system ATPase subunit
MSLPAGFEALEPFVATWAVEGTATRDALRGSSSFAERQAFYDAAQPLLALALDYLDTRDIGNFSAGEQQLMNLMLSLAHVAIAVEIQREDEPKHAAARAHMHITRSVADQ